MWLKWRSRLIYNENILLFFFDCINIIKVFRMVGGMINELCCVLLFKEKLLKLEKL